MALTATATNIDNHNIYYQGSRHAEANNCAHPSSKREHHYTLLHKSNPRIRPSYVWRINWQRRELKTGWIISFCHMIKMSAIIYIALGKFSQSHKELQISQSFGWSICLVTNTQRIVICFVTIIHKELLIHTGQEGKKKNQHLSGVELMHIVTGSPTH